MAKSSAVAVAAAIVSLLCSCISGQYPNPDDGTKALIGLECSPPFGYLRHTCGKEIPLDETFVPAPDYLHG